MWALCKQNQFQATHCLCAFMLLTDLSVFIVALINCEHAACESHEHGQSLDRLQSRTLCAFFKEASEEREFWPIGHCFGRSFYRNSISAVVL